MTLELQFIKITKRENTPFVLVKYFGGINKQSSNCRTKFILLEIDCDVYYFIITGLDFLEHGADYETAISATGECHT